MRVPVTSKNRLLAAAFAGSLKGTALLGFAFMGVSSTANATVVVLHPLDEMSHRANVVVHARVLGSKVIEESGRIITLTEVEVLDGIKGSKQGEIETLYQVGGTLNGRTMHIAGAQTYTQGEEIVLFAMRHGERLVAYGVGVGKFVIDREEQTIREDLGDVVVMTLGEEGMALDENVQPRLSHSVVEFKAALRDLLRLPAPAQIANGKIGLTKKSLSKSVLRRLKNPQQSVLKVAPMLRVKNAGGAQ